MQGLSLGLGGIGMGCEHEFKKTLDKSGMCFISMCHKCKTQEPYVTDEIKKLIDSDIKNIIGRRDGDNSKH